MNFVEENGPKILEEGSRNLIAPNRTYQIFFDHEIKKAVGGQTVLIDKEHKILQMHGRNFEGTSGGRTVHHTDYSIAVRDPQTKKGLPGCGAAIDEETAYDMGFKDPEDEEGENVFVQIQRAILKKRGYGVNFCFADDEEALQTLLPKFRDLARKLDENNELQHEYIAAKVMEEEGDYS